ncbi:MAG: sugar lactone lactonase YvrE [Chlamydiales bacterium]|jgi:sugar lactone lactonase YvrE
MKYFRSVATIGLAALSLGAGSVEVTTGESVPRFTITTVAGTGERGMTLEEVPAVEALIERPTAVAVDSKGRLYIADEQNGLVRMVTRDGFLTTVMGTDSTDRQTKERLAVLTNVSNAYGIATDLEDNLYVLSRGHSKIFKVGSEGYARCIVGNGRQGFGGDGGPALDAMVASPNHLVADGHGNLFIADTGNHRIRKVSKDGVITTVAGTGVVGFAGDGGPAIAAQLGVPSAIAIDLAGNLYIADFFNHRIRKVSTDGIITSIAGTGKSGYNGDGKSAVECQIGEPCGVAVDREGYVYIGDQLNNRVRVVTPKGIMHTVAGTGVRGHTGDGGPAEQAEISNPDILAFDTQGNLYFPDHVNCVVRKLTRVTE